MVARRQATRVLAVALTLTLCILLLCQGLPAMAQEGSGGRRLRQLNLRPGGVGGATASGI